jgi:EAL domain-containing protein (putative c-di-GMP-specific phosphodiesterase class I)
VAEGIERSTEVDTLIELGVTHGQGFFLAPPMSMAELRERYVITRTRP